MNKTAVCVLCGICLFISGATILLSASTGVSATELGKMTGGGICDGTEWWCENSTVYGCQQPSDSCPASATLCQLHSSDAGCAERNQVCKSNACACPDDNFCLDACDSTGCTAFPGIPCATRSFAHCIVKGGGCVQGNIMQVSCGTKTGC